MASPFMDRKQAAQYLGVHPNTLDNLRKNDPAFPVPGYVGTMPRWTEAQLLAYVHRDPASSNAKPVRTTTAKAAAQYLMG